MRALVVGGAGSGKSAFAEQLACSLSPLRTYVATMEPHGPEATARIERHRAQRAGLGFVTLECPRALPATPARPSLAQGVVLLDDVGNLVANALFTADGTMRDPAAVLGRLVRETDALSRGYAHAVVVGNEVGGEGASPHDGTLAWVRLMGALCCRVAASFDAVIEVVAGVPQVVKGRLP